MTVGTTNIFDLPEHLAAKADPVLTAADEQHFAILADQLVGREDLLAERLDALRRAPANAGQTALERDQEIYRVSADLRLLRRYGLDLCLGRMVREDGQTIYLGRAGLGDGDGGQLLVDWRAPAAEPFFAATHADPKGLVSRRRYRWSDGRISDYWDEVFDLDAVEGHAALDYQSAFIASLGTSRSPRMRDVLGTIAADQDAIIRAGSSGALAVDGGPGTGKTVVALHRAAYLLYADPRLGRRRGGVLFVGPHRPYLGYVADVLPSLGEEGVLTCTLADLVPEGHTARPEADPVVARLKADARMATAIHHAAALYEELPSGLLVETAVADVWITERDWADAFDAAEPGQPHNDAQELIWQTLLDILTDRLDEEEDEDRDWDEPEPDCEEVRDEEQFNAYGTGEVQDRRSGLHSVLASGRELRRAFQRAWPSLEPTDLVADLWSVPAYLRRCAPWLTAAEVALLQRDQPADWTTSDLPLLDAARHRVGDSSGWRRRRQQQAAQAAERDRLAQVIDHLIDTDTSELAVMGMLRGQDLQATLLDEPVLSPVDVDQLAGPFSHVVVDEAQELTDAQWQMLLRRCPSRSLTVVGDRAQARNGFPESWQDRLHRLGLERVEQATLTINYRTPAEVMAAAEPVIRAALPGANVPASVRSTGRPVRHGAVEDLDAIVQEWLDTRPEGTACVIGQHRPTAPRVRSLSPTTVKGMEFDLVVLVRPDTFGAGLAGAVDSYVAMTRATQDLVILT